ncbi:hypothetical protein R3P38DRAFT_2759255 [Favolaschia claudopus]|uniref:Argonaute linker 1 domain-containing protein n=1 Tax=Favolaschia claudopus TaxID=2862362 RepID=A0AAW0E9S3_9AGAR
MEIKQPAVGKRHGSKKGEQTTTKFNEVLCGRRTARISKIFSQGFRTGVHSCKPIDAITQAMPWLQRPTAAIHEADIVYAPPSYRMTRLPPLSPATTALIDTPASSAPTPIPTAASAPPTTPTKPAFSPAPVVPDPHEHATSVPRVHKPSTSSSPTLPSKYTLRRTCDPLSSALPARPPLPPIAETRCVFDVHKNLYAPVKLNLGGDSRESHDNTVSTALMAFNVAIRQSPPERFPTKGRSFFTQEGSKAIGAGLVLWCGCFQSIRPAVGRMLINVDISTGVMLDNRMRIKLSRFIAGIRVDTRDPRRPDAPGSRPPRVVRKRNQEGASEVTFMMRDGRSMAVARISLEVGQGALITLELCFVLRGQLVRKEIPDEKKADLVAFATKKPKERLEIQILAYGPSEYVRKFGLTVTPQVVSTQACVLNPPTLKYGQGSKAPNVQPRNGSWNMADKKFFRPSTIATWVLIVLDSRVIDNLLVDDAPPRSTPTQPVPTSPMPIRNPLQIVNKRQFLPNENLAPPQNPPSSETSPSTTPLPSGEYATIPTFVWGVSQDG